MKVVAANSGSGATMNIRIEDVAENVTPRVVGPERLRECSS